MKLLKTLHEIFDGCSQIPTRSTILRLKPPKDSRKVYISLKELNGKLIVIESDKSIKEERNECFFVSKCRASSVPGENQKVCDYILCYIDKNKASLVFIEFSGSKPGADKQIKQTFDCVKSLLRKEFQVNMKKVCFKAVLIKTGASPDQFKHLQKYFQGKCLIKTLPKQGKADITTFISQSC